MVTSRTINLFLTLSSKMTWLVRPAISKSGFVQSVQSDCNTLEMFLPVKSNLVWLWNSLLMQPMRLSHFMISCKKVFWHVQDNSSNETLLIYRTAAPGSYGQCLNADGSPLAPNAGIFEQHVNSLNAAARGILQRHPRWHLLDLEALVAGFACPQEYLRDALHVNPDMVWNILNMYLNMLADFWQVHGEPSWRKVDRVSST